MVEGKNWIISFDIDQIYNKIEEYKNFKNILLIFDDFINEINKNKDKRLDALFFNRRHLLKEGVISIIVVS